MNPGVLIITDGHLCRNPRPLKEATALCGTGYKVTMLTVRNHAQSDANDEKLLAALPVRHECIDMLSAGNPSVILRRLLLWSARRAAARLGAATIHSLGPAASLLRRARRLEADLTIVHNETPHWVGVRLVEHGRRVAADYEDWHSEDLLPAARRRRPLALLREIERTLVHRCAYVSTTSQALAGALQSRHGGPSPHVITNSFPLQSDPRAGGPGDPPVFFWFSQTLGPGRGLEGFLDAWARMRIRSQVVLLGQSRGGYAETLLGRVPEARRRDVTLLAPVPPAGLPRLIARHDIGLALEDPEIPSRDATITNKILQYLNAGLAVVATPTSGQREVLSRGSEAGVLADFRTPDRAAPVLDEMLADRAVLHRRQKAARRLAEGTYCWEREEPRLLALVASVLPR